MIHRNPHLKNLKKHYLFPKVMKRRDAFLEKNPNSDLISLSIGDTTEPMPVANTFYNNIEPDEITISDGAKCDIGRLQMLFGSGITTAIQDPAYPAYVDTSHIAGQNIVYLPCTKENNFFPDLKNVPPVNLIWFCSPNNPTGAVATHEQLEELVHFAKKNHAIILFDTAYTSFIQDPTLPKTIYDIPGAHDCAIEIGSFSKMAGFAGLRLGWSVVPKALGEIHTDWLRLLASTFNGASRIVQAGGISVLSSEGLIKSKENTQFYLENGGIILEACKQLEIFGGVNTPYLWIDFSPLTSWEAFDLILEKTHIITTPGSGFGPAGEGYIRISTFGNRSKIEEAATRLHKEVLNL